jgi:threonylcarbamoyladenosine tRNA methylthiotransferase MtaB
VIDNIERASMIHDVFPLPQRARYFLKIQDGCTEKCTYCVVAKVRDRLESRSPGSITREIEWAKANGFKEIVLVGANIGLYGAENGSSLEDLLSHLSKVRDLPRIRLSSCEPKYISPGLIERLKAIPFCRHFHVPIQSADDRVLERMGRGYDRAFLKERISMITGDFPDAAIGADVIVGFPGESEREFENTCEFIREERFMHLHVFPYSPRPVTEAFRLGDEVTYHEKKRRLWRLRDLIKVKNREFRQAMLGKTFTAVIERHAARAYGLTDNYVRAEINGDAPEKELVMIEITGLEGDRTFGRVVR